MTLSMPAMPRSLELYEEICTLSERMVDAARRAEWDHLVALEQRVAALRDTLMNGDDDTLTPGEAHRKRELIQRILDDDAEVRRHTEPWMEQVRKFLGAGAQARRVSAAYRAV